MQGFGANRRLTLMDLVNRLALELSEPARGTWKDVTYQYDLNNTQHLNELAWLINMAQDYTCRHLYDKSFAFFESEFQHPILPNANKYRLPENFIAMESVFHHRGQDFCEVMEANIKEYEKLDGYNGYIGYGGYGTYPKDNFYSYYEVRGNIGTIVYQGQVASDAMSHETVIVGTFDTAKILVGDTLYNEIDGSTGQIMEITNSRLEVDELSGGRSNTFEPGDAYHIESALQPYECMRVFPVVSKIQEMSLHNGKPDGWEVKFPRQVTRV